MNALEDNEARPVVYFTGGEVERHQNGQYKAHGIPIVKPWELLGQTRAPDGADLSLTLRSGEYVILANGKSLMSSRMHGSEEALAAFACARIRDREAPRVLVGGLGMGFTLRATLDHLPEDAAVVVAELIPAVVEWNRGPLGPLAGHPLTDRRVQVVPGDVAVTLRARSTPSCSTSTTARPRSPPRGTPRCTAMPVLPRRATRSPTAACSRCGRRARIESSSSA